MLKLKFVKAFLYAAATVASPSCSLFSWIFNSVHSMATGKVTCKV